MFFKGTGKNPSGKLLEKIKSSPHYKKETFENLSPTPIMLHGSSSFEIFRKFVFKNEDTRPSAELPSIKADIKNINRDAPVIVWFGHSSYFISFQNKNFLIDPVFSGSASPFPFMVKAFPGSNIYSVDDLPEIDFLILTHDHYDHLDYETIKKLRPKIHNIYCSLGVSSHLTYWGFDVSSIVEMDWGQQSNLGDGITLTAATARHFSGRSFSRCKTLWSSFILKSRNYNLYLGGDSGYHEQFKQLGEDYGPFDIAILESGQYNSAWPLIHMMPEQAVQAAVELKAKLLLPVHWGKFSLALHPWDEPVKRVLKAANDLRLCVTTPMIGEPVCLDGTYPQSYWWEL